MVSGLVLGFNGELFLMVWPSFEGETHWCFIMCALVLYMCLYVILYPPFSVIGGISCTCSHILKDTYALYDFMHHIYNNYTMVCPHARNQKVLSEGV